MGSGRYLAAAALVLLCACGPADEPRHARISAFGTIVEVSIRNGDAGQAGRAVAAVDAEFQRLHQHWHAWDPGPLVDINRAIAAGSTIEVDAGTADVIERARQLERASGGRFNPAIGRLLAAWGFHASELPEGPPPDAALIAQLVAERPSLADLTIEGGILRSANPAVQLDFGAYIKGHAVDRAMAILRAAGIEHAIVNAGGDLGVIGDAGGRPWRAGVRHPDGAGGAILATVTLRPGEVAFTSGNYLRYRTDDGIRYGHIIDPRSGYPADHVASVTVIHDRGDEADAAATALAVAGPDEWPKVARRMAMAMVMRVAADGAIELTPNMAARVRLPDSAAATLRSLPPAG